MSGEHPQPPLAGSMNRLSLKKKLCIALVTANIIMFVGIFAHLKIYEQIYIFPVTMDSMDYNFKPTPVALQVVPLNIEHNASSLHVHDILHNPEEASITVNFRENRTCIRPQLIGRLSGGSLSIIEWNYDVDSEQSQNNTVLVGRYNVPSRGMYFIEIIVTMCQRLSMDTDIKKLCLVDPKHHRFTHENATIDVTQIRKKSTDIGVWYNMNGIADNSFILPLHTRYQPHGCIKNNYLDHCKKPTDIARYEPYKFLFEPQYSSFKSLSGGKGGTLCFVGSSHAGVLKQFALKMGADVRHVRVNYVADFTRDAIEEVHLSNCSKIIISTGQWDAGWKDRAPTSFHDFKTRLNQAMKEFVIPLREANKSIYFRNLQ